MSDYYLYNIANLVIAKSSNGKPLRGKEQGNLEIIPDAYVLVKNGLIAEFGKREEYSLENKTFIPIDMQQKLVMPAFIDPHTHLVFAGSREDEFIMRLQGASYLDILAKGYGIHQTVENTKKASFEQLVESALIRLNELKRYGTAGVEIKSGYGLEPETEIKQLKVIQALKKTSNHAISSTFLAAHALPIQYKNRRDIYIHRLIEETIPEIAKQKLADFIDVFCEKDVFSITECEKILEKGAAVGLKVKLHSDEFYAIGGISLAAKINAVSVDHMITARQDELSKLREKDTVAVILPGTSFYMRHTNLDYARKIISNDIPLAIGSDFNPGTCMCYSQQLMMELSVLLYGLTIKEAINAVTVNASFAAGLEEKTGLMQKGLRADLISLDIKNINEIPYRWGINKIHRIFLSGDMVEFEVG